jgi:hypothetical protein
VDLRSAAKTEEEEEAVVDVSFEGGVCHTVAKKTWATGDVLLHGIQLLHAPAAKLTHAMIVVLARGEARGSDTLDLSSVSMTDNDDDDDSWILRFLFSTGGSEKEKANVRVEMEKGSEGAMYRVVVTAPLAVGHRLVTSSSL